MNTAHRRLHAVDRLQQRTGWLAVPVATWKKFGDDQAGNLAALVAYYAFAALFPLLLVLVTILDLVLRNNPALRSELLNSALARYPVIGEQLRSSVHPLQETGIALAIGLAFALLAALGVANAIQNALNTTWEVPFARRPRFPWSALRSLGLIAVVGPGQIATIFLSSIAGGTGHVLDGAGAHVAAVAVSLVLNAGLFWLAFRLGTAAEVASRDLVLGAVLSAVAWQVLQLLGGYLVAHQLARNSTLYGAFGIVLGLLAWLYLQAQITLYAVELNAVRALRLWPRSLFPPPLTPQDLSAYRLYARAAVRSPGLDVELRQTEAGTGDGGGR